MFLKKVEIALKKYDMLRPKDRVLIGVSGGPDSVALLFALFYLQKDFMIDIMIGHLNHMFRPGSSKKAEKFVRQMAEEMELPFLSKEVKKMSAQEAAREVRYDFFLEEARRHSADKVALGHNADDQAETILMRIIKGTGTKGLGGIPPVRDDFFIRPLIEIKREEIEEFLKTNKIEYITDPSNCKPIYMRNRLRLELIPKIKKEYNPHIAEELLHLGHILREDEDYINNIVEELAVNMLKLNNNDELELNIKPYVKLPVSLQRRIIRKGIALAGGEIRGISFKHVSDIMGLITEKPSGKLLNLPNHVVVQKEYDKLIFRKKGRKKILPFHYQIKVPCRIDISAGTSLYRFDFTVKKRDMKESFQKKKREPFRAFLDLDKAGMEFVIRNRRPGDRFQPYGMEGTKKLKEYFIDEKIPAGERGKIPLLTKGSEVLWVPGWRVSDRVKLTKETKKALIIEACIL
jgi:tRNA(Ile)-lysidine synthase